jgi:hypothetical protein
MIVGIQRTTRYPGSSLTQVLNFMVNRGGGRTEAVPVEIIFVKSGGGYTVQSMFIVKASAVMANTQRATQLPVPEPGGRGGGGGTGTNPPAPSKSDQCKNKCFPTAHGTPIEIAQAGACYFACLLGLPIPAK